MARKAHGRELLLAGIPHFIHPRTPRSIPTCSVFHSWNHFLAFGKPVLSVFTDTCCLGATAANFSSHKKKKTPIGKGWGMHMGGGVCIWGAGLDPLAIQTRPLMGQSGAVPGDPQLESS